MAWTANTSVQLNGIPENNHPDDITAGTPGDPPGPLTLSAGTWQLEDGHTLAVSASAVGYDIVEFPASAVGPLQGGEEIAGTVAMSINGTEVGSTSGSGSASWTQAIDPSGTFESDGTEMTVSLDGAGTETGSFEGFQFEERVGQGRAWSTDNPPDNQLGFVVTIGDAIQGVPVDGDNFAIDVGPATLGYDDIVSYSLELDYTFGIDGTLQWSDDFPDFDMGSYTTITSGGGSGSPVIGSWDVVDVPFIRVRALFLTPSVNPEDASEWIDIQVIPTMATMGGLRVTLADDFYDIFLRPI